MTLSHPSRTITTSDDPDILEVDTITRASDLDALIAQLYHGWNDGRLTPAELEGLALRIVTTCR